MAGYTNVKVSVEDRVAVLTIDHPPANAFNHATLADLDAALDELIADDQVKVIIITGAGEFAFSPAPTSTRSRQSRMPRRQRSSSSKARGSSTRSRRAPSR